MKLRDKGSSVVYNVPQEVGQKLVASGLAVEVAEQVAAKKFVAMTWRVQDGPREGDFQHPPQIYARCSECEPAWQSSRIGIAHQMIKYRHRFACPAAPIPGIAEVVPQHIVEEYLKKWTAYISRSRRKTVVLPTLAKDTSVAGSGNHVQSFSVKLVPAKG